MDNKTCSECFGTIKFTKTKYGERADCYNCKLTGWNGKPLVSMSIRTARIEAHKYFDALHKEGGLCYDILKDQLNNIIKIPNFENFEYYMDIVDLIIMLYSRTLAYEWLSSILNINFIGSHMGNMNEVECINVIKLCKNVTRDNIILNGKNTLSNYKIMLNNIKFTSSSDGYLCIECLDNNGKYNYISNIPYKEYL